MGLLDFLRCKPRDTYDYGETLHADPDYRVTFRAGEPDKAVLAFCGIGFGVGEVQIEEFRSSLGSLASVYFLADVKRSWWNDGRVETAIEAAMRRARGRDPQVAFSALGNSMDGSGAILAAHLHPEVERCLAFVPQADIRMSSPETRWRKHRRRIRRHRWPTFLLPSAGAAQRLVFGAQADQGACAQFAAAGFSVDVVDAANHRVAGHLRDSEPERYWEMMRFVTMT